MRSVIVGVQNLLDTMMVGSGWRVGLTATLNTQMERNAKELQLVRHQLANTRRENEALGTALQGGDPAAQAQDATDDWIAMIPKNGNRSDLQLKHYCKQLGKNPNPTKHHLWQLQLGDWNLRTNICANN